MTAQIIDGKAVAKSIRATLAADVGVLKQQGIEPGLTAVLVGENAASVVYVRNKRKACSEVGIARSMLT